MQSSQPAAAERNWFQGLDGIRAIAVTIVFLQHYATKLSLNAGWIGVQIFFVLSGFLITGILFDSRLDPFRFRNFYIRRSLRIFPLFFFTWLLILLGGFYLHLQWRPWHTLWVVYLGNFTRFLVGSLDCDHIYTAFPQLPIEIGHYWSLAIEEQFYLFWPLIVFLVANRKVLIRICMVAVVFSPLLRLVLYCTLPQWLLSLDFVFRFTLTQCDSFLLGGLIALLMRGDEQKKILGAAKWLLYPSLLCLVFLHLQINGWRLRDLNFEHAWMPIFGMSLVNLASAGLILSSLHTGSFIYRITASWPLRQVGRYSYGFYVYHVLLAPFLHTFVWPLSESSRTPQHYLHAGLALILDFALVLTVSVLSYHFLEAPFLRLKDRWTVRVPAVPVVASA
ncbi:MAG: acyltransferase [Terracidiphilus sp.]|nr:acyltransferase [Terracidiphilus sp.]